MDVGIYAISDLPDDKVNELLQARRSFILTGVSRLNFGAAVEAVEQKIEAQGLKCRVYTSGRKAAIAAIAIPTPATIIGGVASAVAMGAHNVATWDPDYEIAKNLALGQLEVTYKK